MKLIMRLWYRGRNYDSSVKHDILFMQTTSQTIAHNIAQIIAQELNVREQQVTATIALLDDGATVPFVARYRKEATGGLDDTQLRTYIVV